MILVMVTALMLQLQSFSRLALVLLTAPLGLIGVAAPSSSSTCRSASSRCWARSRCRDDHAQLGDPGRPDRPRHRDGSEPADAIADATVRRFRPIMLTAAAACWP
jgi:multidrug efflux pump subunit AcrB